MSNKQGKLAEQQACQYLQQQGYQLITQNYHCQGGEIDLIMRAGSKRNTIVFVEVRYRRNNTFGSALESITWQKQQKIKHTALYYLQQQRLIDQVAVQFDVVAICPQQQPEIEWIAAAFE